MLDKVKEVQILLTSATNRWSSIYFLDKDLARTGQKRDRYSKAMGRGLGISVGI